MEDKKTFSRSNLVSAAIGVLIMGVLYSLQDRSFVWLILCGCLALGIIIAYILSLTLWKSTQAIEADICKRLGKEGYHYEKNEGTLYVTKNDSRNHAYRAIGEAIEDYGRLIPYLERYYPNTAKNQSNIGFRQND